MTLLLANPPITPAIAETMKRCNAKRNEWVCLHEATTFAPAAVEWEPDKPAKDYPGLLCVDAENMPPKEITKAMQWLYSEFNYADLGPYVAFENIDVSRNLAKYQEMQRKAIGFGRERFAYCWLHFYQLSKFNTDTNYFADSVIPLAFLCADNVILDMCPWLVASSEGAEGECVTPCDLQIDHDRIVYALTQFPIYAVNVWLYNPDTVTGQREREACAYLSMCNDAIATAQTRRVRAIGNG